MTQQLYTNLEFDTVCKKIAELAASEVTAAELLNTRPTTYIEDAEKLLDRVGDAIAILASHRPDLDFADITTYLDKARVGAALSPYELLRVRKNISALRSLKNCVESADGCDSLKDVTAWVRSSDGLAEKIDRAVESETSLKDSASDKLYSLRRSIAKANARLKERLDSYTRQSEISKYLQDNIVTVRNGRYVIPLRSECRSNIKGLVHDVSATGATVFVEPFTVVEANNELKTLKTEEANEVERILAELSADVRESAAELSEGQRVLTECGVIFAKAEYAKKTDSFRPKLNTDGNIRLTAARHPLISADKVVPVDIIVDRRVLLISGPNTGGKTVVLKTVGLFALMAASGMFLPVKDGSEISIFDEIYCDIGDEQSIAQSLSTFSAHIKNISHIMRQMNGNSLVLLDEPGDGTDPEEGAALAVAVLKKILSSGAAAVVTTHFHAVKQFALESDDVANACMQFDASSLTPTYKMLMGVSGSSYALEIAENLGLDGNMIAEARKHISTEKTAFDKMMHEAEKLRNAALSDKEQCEALRLAAQADAKKTEQLRAEYESKLAELKDGARAAIRKQADEYAAVAEELIDEIRSKLKDADEAALFEARRLAKKLQEGVPSDVKRPSDAKKPAEIGELKDGVRVFVSGLNKEGVISGKPRGNKAFVAIGSVKTELPISSLSVIREEGRTAPRADDRRETAEPVTREIMLLGYTVDDATDVIDREIDDCPPHSTLRIVHGKGTGALGKGIQNHLKRHPRIKTFRYGRYGEGDNGVTIAELK